MSQKKILGICLVVAVALLLAGYVRCYYVFVEPRVCGYFGGADSSYALVVPVCPEGTFWLFEPMYHVDRSLRPKIWNPDPVRDDEMASWMASHFKTLPPIYKLPDIPER